MTDKITLKWIYIISGLFIVINAILIAFEQFWFPLLPVAAAILLLSLLSLDKLVLLIVFCTPFSVNIKDIGMGYGLSLPTDPLMFGVMILFFLKLLFEKKFDAKVGRHPITIAIIIYLIWIGLSCLTSEMPVVSIKFLIERLWFIVTFYFIGTQLFNKINNIGWYIWLYIISLSGVAIYTIIHHWMYGFLEQPAHWVMSPFYNDHTSYGAILAMFYPFLCGMLFSRNLLTRSMKVVIFGLLLLFSVALILSYTRAAWLSLVIALFIYILIKFKVEFKTILMTIGIVVGILFSFQDQIVMKLEKNRQDSSADFAKHVQSISNISSDASNLERFNRWKSAIRMFVEKPFFGWGPGTYMFKYAPFQNSNERTSISTNAGDRGNAHSEYIGPLAEQGFFGTVAFL